MHESSSRRRAAPAILLCLAGLASWAHAVQGKVWANGLALPLFVTAPKGDARAFVVEQAGVVEVSRGGQMSVFLDISGIVDPEGTGGLLGLAFDPQYESNGRFYVDYV